MYSLPFPIGLKYYMPITLSIEEIRDLLPQRRIDAHKGSMGKVLVIAGSRGMTGAAILSSKSVLRAGAGVVTLATVNYLVDLIDVQNLEVMTAPLPETDTGCISSKALDMVAATLNAYDTLLIGPGISANKSTQNFVHDLLKYISTYHKNLKVVVDADALKVIRKIVRPLRMPVIITPHFGELGYILKRTPGEIAEKAEYYAHKLADRCNVVVVLKSHQTIIAEPGKARSFMNINGNPGMATAGSGDVLAGIITGTWASTRISPVKAAVAGVFIHGLAGGYAAAKKSLDSLIASDILDEIPTALKAIKGI